MLADADAQGHRGMQTVQAPVVPGHGLAYPLGDLGSLPDIRPRQQRQELLPAPAPDTVTFAQGFAQQRAHLTQHPVAAVVPVQIITCLKWSTSISRKASRRPACSRSAICRPASSTMYPRLYSRVSGSVVAMRLRLRWARLTVIM